MRQWIDKLQEERTLQPEEFRQLLTECDGESLRYINKQAQEVSLRHFGNRIFIRGLIEVSNCCRNNCYYCGIRKGNPNLERYRLSTENILNCCKQGYDLGFRTFVLQGGEDPVLTDERIEDIVSTIRRSYPDCAITLSLGEKSREAYERFFQAGANRYLLRHETYDKEHYQQLHPTGMSCEHRLQCLRDLKDIGYQTGTGIMVGSPGQTIKHLIQDILFIEQLRPEMIGIGPFLPHGETPFAQSPSGTVEQTLLLLSIFRLMHPSALIPATTALATLTPDGRERGILAGANAAIMSATTTGAVAQSKNDIPWNKHVRQKKTPGDLAVDFVIVLLLVFTVVAVLYPLWFVVIASFSDPNAVAGGEVTLLPKGVTFVGYAKVFANHRIWQGYLNTIIYSVVGTAVNMSVTIPCAFALSRREFKPRRVIMFLFTVTMFISGGLIPNYLLYKALGINNTMWVFILPGAVSVYNVIVARSFFETSIPEELHDAAQIDGLSYFGYFFKIVLPLSSAILAVIGLYYFVGHWNDFMTGLIYITDDSKQPLQVVLQQLLLVAQGTGTNVNAAAQQQAADQIKFGIIIVSTLPLLVLYPFLQKYFNKGVMLGAVKG